MKDEIKKICDEICVSFNDGYKNLKIDTIGDWTQVEFTVEGGAIQTSLFNGDYSKLKEDLILKLRGIIVEHYKEESNETLMNMVRKEHWGMNPVFRFNNIESVDRMFEYLGDQPRNTTIPCWIFNADSILSYSQVRVLDFLFGMDDDFTSYHDPKNEESPIIIMHNSVGGSYEYGKLIEDVTKSYNDAFQESFTANQTITDFKFSFNDGQRDRIKSIFGFDIKLEAENLLRKYYNYDRAIDIYNSKNVTMSEAASAASCLLNEECDEKVDIFSEMLLDTYDVNVLANHYENVRVSKHPFGVHFTNDDCENGEKIIYDTYKEDNIFDSRDLMLEFVSDHNDKGNIIYVNKCVISKNGRYKLSCAVIGA